MAKGIKKTNAMRILDGLKIKYEVGEYEADVDHVLEKGAAARMAEKLGVAPVIALAAVDLRLTEAQEIEIGAVKYQNFHKNHSKSPGLPPRGHRCCR